MNFKIKYVADDGQFAEFIPENIEPLNFADIVKAKNGERCEINFKVGNSAAIINNEIIDSEGTASFNIEFNKDQKIYAVCEDGWLPFPFLPKSTLLVDRNVIDAIKKILEGKNSDAFKTLDWWFKLKGSHDIKINPVLYAFEGKNQSTPSYEEFCEEFNEAISILENYSAFFGTVQYQEKHYQVAYNILLEKKDKFFRESYFLQLVAPLVVFKHKGKKFVEIEDEIKKYALQYELKDNSLSYLLVMSCLYEDAKGVIPPFSREILKPKATYTEKMAFNALSDLLGIELLLNIQKMATEEKFMLCTRDWALACFWVGLSPKYSHSNNGKMYLTYQKNENIFPRLHY